MTNDWKTWRIFKPHKPFGVFYVDKFTSVYFHIQSVILASNTLLWGGQSVKGLTGNPSILYPSFIANAMIYLSLFVGWIIVTNEMEEHCSQSIAHLMTMSLVSMFIAVILSLIMHEGHYNIAIGEHVMFLLQLYSLFCILTYFIELHYKEKKAHEDVVKRAEPERKAEEEKKAKKAAEAERSKKTVEDLNLKKPAGDSKSEKSAAEEENGGKDDSSSSGS